MRKQSIGEETVRGHFEQRAILLLQEALRHYPGVKILASQGADAVLRLRDGSTIALELKSSAPSPGDDAHAGLIRVFAGAPKSVQERLRERGQSFVDLKGTVHLSLPQMLIDRTGVRVAGFPAGPSVPFDAFSDRSSLIVRTLLGAEGQRDREWGIREIAAAAGVAPATATRVVRRLERDGAVQVSRSGRTARLRVTSARALFELWTRRYDWTRNSAVPFHAPVGDPIRFLRRAKGAFASRRWMLTLQAGAALVAPHAAWDRIHVYVDAESVRELQELGHREGWTQSNDGGLVLMKPYYRESVWHDGRMLQDLPVASDLQLALDLWYYPVRGREQAEHLLSVTRLLR